MAVSPRQKRRLRSGRAGKDRVLTHRRIAASGLALLDREGFDALTMRRLAGVLGVTPMALYNHVSSKRDLLRAVAGHVLGAARFDGGHRDWRTQIGACFRTLRRLCLRHPGLARLLETAGVAPAMVFVPMEVTLRALGRAGLGSRDALRTYFTLVSFTLHQAFPTSSPRRRSVLNGWPAAATSPSNALIRSSTRVLVRHSNSDWP